MYVLGIDAGFSATRKTSCYCSFRINGDEISFANEPVKFNDYAVLQKIAGKYHFDIITVDAPITPELIHEKPGEGRKIEMVFSNRIFNNSKRGPQPSSIAVPRQGWPLYNAGMNITSALKPYQYLSIGEINNSSRTGIYEVLPKLTQSLLVKRECVINRGKQKIDDYVFPKLFAKNGEYRRGINSLLGSYKFSQDVESYLNLISANTKKYHEELASFVCAFQGVLIAINKASFIGFEGKYEGYYALPSKEYWDLEWFSCFVDLVEVKYQGTVDVG